jgi:endonuclease/exonuclease/phosphatase family metal-dependent hydrolase
LKVFLWKTRRLTGLMVLAALLWLTACQSTQNYPEADSPLFTGNYAETPAKFDGQLKIVTWNIRFGEAVETAIDELIHTPELQEADILLLQEMDEIGVEAIAKTLKYNYVYYPASIHPHHQKNFGEAILSRWPLTDPQKLILPYKNPKNDQIRLAVRATLSVDGIELPVYSAHTETFWLDYDKRMAQVEALVNDIDPAWPNVIVGGDFNTMTEASVSGVEHRFEAAQLSRVSTGGDDTFTAMGLGFTTDHIFARGFSVVESGVWPDTTASDHYPVWVLLQLTSPVQEVKDNN